jgi:predicted lysophospholipase L1 biosynthesis ABC-type transport system permease subunit
MVSGQAWPPRSSRRLSRPQRANLNMVVLTIFGSMALVLAVIGIYGVMAYSVRQRTREIGIRVALGADVYQVRNMVLRQGMRLALVGEYWSSLDLRSHTFAPPFSLVSPLTKLWCSSACLLC